MGPMETSFEKELQLNRGENRSLPTREAICNSGQYTFSENYSGSQTIQKTVHGPTHLKA